MHTNHICCTTPTGNLKSDILMELYFWTSKHAFYLFQISLSCPVQRVQPEVYFASLANCPYCDNDHNARDFILSTVAARPNMSTKGGEITPYSGIGIFSMVSVALKGLYVLAPSLPKSLCLSGNCSYTSMDNTRISNLKIRSVRIFEGISQKVKQHPMAVKHVR